MGVDPGNALCGYGVIITEGTRLRALAYGAIATSAAANAGSRLKVVFEGIEDIIRQYRPAIVGVEQLFFNKNIRTAMSVSQARGVVLLAAARNGIPVVEFSPLQVKQSVVGYGRATKDQVVFMTQKLLGLTERPHPDDAADALAVAICAAHRGETISRQGDCPS